METLNYINKDGKSKEVVSKDILSYMYYIKLLFGCESHENNSNVFGKHKNDC